jgi:enoyl-CoA hydratase/carnithine racemase
MAILFDARDGIARITINRPEVLNALDPATYAELPEAFDQIDGEPIAGTSGPRPPSR